jgi:hypothetical protein
MFGDWIVDYCEDGVFLRALTVAVCGTRTWFFAGADLTGPTVWWMLRIA